MGSRFMVPQEVEILNIYGLILMKDGMVGLHPSNFARFIKGYTRCEDIFKGKHQLKFNKSANREVIYGNFFLGYIFPLVSVSDTSYKLHIHAMNEKEAKKKARIWVMTENSYYFNRSPFEMCMLGEGGRVLSSLSEQLASIEKTPVSVTDRAKRDTVLALLDRDAKTGKIGKKNS